MFNSLKPTHFSLYFKLLNASISFKPFGLSTGLIIKNIATSIDQTSHAI